MEALQEDLACECSDSNYETVGAFEDGIQISFFHQDEEQHISFQCIEHAKKLRDKLTTAIIHAEIMRDSNR